VCSDACTHEQKHSQHAPAVRNRALDHARRRQRQQQQRGSVVASAAVQQRLLCVQREGLRRGQQGLWRAAEVLCWCVNTWTVHA
jgi:hypothetical protein